jgi:transmembrane sensor
LAPSQQAALEAWLSGRPDRQALLERHERLLADPAMLLAAKRVSRQGEAGRPARRAPLFPWVTASGLVAASLACLVLVDSMPRGERIRGEQGRVEAITLGDGSTVRLNGTSEVRADLRRRARALHLKGEGFFEVAADKNRPFTVDAGDVRVTAVGTRFNVEQHDTPDGPLVEVAVLEGVVEVVPKKGSVTRVKAGERVRVLKGAVQHAVLDRAEDETALPAWTQGWLELDEASMLSVIDDLNRATGVKVELTSRAMGQALVSGRFAYGQPENALAAIARLHGYKLTRQGPDRYVMSEG